MTLPVGQRGYTQGSGTVGINNYIAYNRDPSSLNLGNGQLFQIWQNTSTKDLFILTAFYWSSGSLNATWEQYLFEGDAIESLNVDTSSGTGTDPTLPTAAGQVTFTGGQVAAGTTANVIQTNSTAASSVTWQIQRSQAVASTTVADNGVAHFNSAHFSVDSNGFVGLLGGGQAIDSFIPASGTSPIVPNVSGEVNVPAGNGITTVGSLNTLTINMNSPFTGDFTFTSVTSGDTETLTISNSSNTASSQAQVLVSVAGGTAGDAWDQWTVGSTTSYCLGIDNSDSDILKLNYSNSASVNPSSGTRLMQMTSGGAMGLGTGTPTADFLSIVNASIGGQVWANIINTDATNPASSASFVVQTQPAAGDPTSTWAVYGVTTWTAGIDNSASDGWAMCVGSNLGTNNVSQVTTAGVWSYPLQVAFSAYINAPQANQTGAGAAISPVVFDATTANVQSAYNTATGNFTAPVAGQYLFACTLTLYAVSGALTSIDIRFHYNAGAQDFQFGDVGNIREPGGELASNGTICVPMAAGDTMSIYAAAAGMAGNTAGFQGLVVNVKHCQFYGMKVA